MTTPPSEYRGRWVPTGRLHTPRLQGHTVTALPDGRVLIVGGDAVRITADVELLDPATGTSTRVAPLQHARAFHVACLLSDGRVLVAGGSRSKKPEPLPTEIYDPIRDRWTSAEPPNRSYGGPLLPMACAALPGGRALLVGGLTPSDGWDEPEEWTGASWVGTGQRLTLGMSAGLAPLPNGSIFLGSRTGHWIRRTDGTFTPLPRPRVQRVEGSCAALPDGSVLTTGGAGPPSERSCERFNGTWRPAAPLDTGRHAHHAFTLDSGVVLVVGGMSGPASMRSAIAYDPAEDLWYHAGLLSTWRQGAQAVALPGGRVLVVGGVHPRGTLGSYTPFNCELFIDDGNTLGRTVSRPRRKTASDDAATERNILRALYEEWHQLNHELFSNRLSPVTMELADMERRLAEWVPARSSIRVSRSAVRTLLWPQVRELLKHEMAHQYVTEVYRAHDESAHGAAFRKVCAQFGIDARAAGLPSSGLTPEEELVHRRVQKLRALSQSSNAHEAQSAQALADKLVAEYRELFAAEATETRDGFSVQHVGTHQARRNAFDHALATFLVQHCRVRVIWVNSVDVTTGQSGSVLEVIGTPSNIERAAYLHDVLRQSIQSLWEADKKAQGGGSARQRVSFMVAALEAFSERLKKSAAPQERALVHLEGARLDGYVSVRHPRLVSSRGGGGIDVDAASRGRRAGENLTVHEGVGVGGGRRLLTS